jgi:hypothetical protein
MNYLTALFNLSLAKANIPSIWKKALVIPVVKPGKPAEVSTSYRPISLLCPAAKILERLLLPDITEALKPADCQHDFRPPISAMISSGFNHSKLPLRTVVVALDLSKAFDTVNLLLLPLPLLLEQITQTDLHPNLVR